MFCIDFGQVVNPYFVSIGSPKSSTNGVIIRAKLGIRSSMVKLLELELPSPGWMPCSDEWRSDVFLDI